MTPSRDDLLAMLEAMAADPVPAPDAAFADELERRLRAVHASVAASGGALDRPARRPLRSRLLRLPVPALIALGLAASAATAAVVTPAVRHLLRTPSTAEAPRSVPPDGAGRPTATFAPPTAPLPAPETTAAAVTGSPDPLHSTPPTSSGAGSTVEFDDGATIDFGEPAVDASIVPAPTTSTTTMPTATTPATTTVPEPTTTGSEGRFIPSFAMSCAAAGGRITCTWAQAAPAGTSYRMLRSEPSATRGRVFTVAPDALAFDDPIAAPGAIYSYLLQAVDGTGTVVMASRPAIVTCC